MAEAVVDNPPAKTGAPAAKRPLPGMSFLENIAQMPMLRQIGLMVGLAASVAIGWPPPLHSRAPLAALRGAGAPAAKSAALLLVSLQPSPPRSTASVLLGAGAGALPSAQLALLP